MADLRYFQPSFTAGELAPALWARVDIAKYTAGLKVAKNLIVHAHGGVSNRSGLQFINEVKDSADKARLIPFQFNTEQSYILEFGDKYFRVYKDGGVVLSGGVPYEVVTPYAHTDLGLLVFAQEADVMYIVHPDYEVRKLSRLADDDWTLAIVTFAPKMTEPGTPTATATVVELEDWTPRNYYYKVAAVNDETGEESLPSPQSNGAFNDLGLKGNYNTITWSPVAGASRYIVYKEDNGIYGYIGGTEATTFRDENIVPDLNDTPQSGHNPFSGTGNYPRCVTFIEQRLGFASTKNEPQAVWLSQSGNYENFGTSRPAKASDAVAFRIQARQVNEVRSMLPVKGLMLLTSGAEWVVWGGTQSDAITPSSLKIDNHGYRGAARVQPIVVGNTVLFAQDRGGVVRDFSYDFTSDSYTGNDLTILARHLFDNKNIKAWGFCQAPSSIAWTILDDGSLVSLTFMKEHEVWAWTRHESACEATFEDVAVISEGNEDVPYFIVRRNVNGQWKRYIERLHTRVFETIADAFFVDSGLSYEGSPTSTLSGLEHLEGEEVVALADGNVIRGLTVESGAITIPIAASKVHVGLPYEAAMQTLDLDLGNMQSLGSVQGRMKSISEVVLRVENTRGIFVGPYDGERGSLNLVEYRQRSTEPWGEPIKPFTGDIRVTTPWDWNTSGSMWVKQFDPLPMTILAIAPDVTIGR